MNILQFEGGFKPQNFGRIEENSGVYNEYHPGQGFSGSYKPVAQVFYPNSPIPNQNSAFRKENTLDYFNDSSKKPEEEYFPYGKPGGGAPNRNDQGQIIAKRPANQFFQDEDNKNQGKTTKNNAKPHANWTFDQQSALRDQKKDEWRKTLLVQVQEKEKIKQMEKEKNALEEKKAEEKIANELKELEKKYKSEIRGEQGLPPEPEYEKKAAFAKKTRKIEEVVRESPQPIVKEMAPVVYQKPSIKSYEYNPLKIEYWRAQSDLSVQHNSFNEILLKLRSDADKAHLERNEAMLELDRYRELLRVKVIDDEVSAQYKKIYQGNYSSNHIEQYKNLKIPSAPRSGYLKNRVLAGESKFVPLVSAGNTVVNASKLKKTTENNEYEEISNDEIKNQLAELDQLFQKHF